jgi:hypothetical protein
VNSNNHLNHFTTKFIDWIFKIKQPGYTIFKGGMMLIILAVGVGFSAQYESQSANGINKFIFHSSTQEFWIQVSVLILGSIFSIIGAFFWIKTNQDENSSDRKKRLIVIEQRGLRNTTDNALSEFVAKHFKGQIISILTDIRENIIDGKVTNPSVALEKVKHITFSLQESCKNISSENLTIVHGGMLPVPYTFLTGVLLDDENNITPYDWDREVESWRKVEGEDDKHRFKFIKPDNIKQGGEVVLAISISYRTDIDNIKLSFPNIPIVEMELENIATQSHWSKEKQSALAIQFLDFVKQLNAEGIKKINFIIAGQNSLIFRFGRVYDKRNLPQATIWQYDRTESPVFNWGIELPVGSRIVPIVVKNRSPITVPESE